jgi:type IV pilus assembly protein PilC
MLYKYTASTAEGEKQSGAIEAATAEIAIRSLQGKNLIILSLKPAEKSGFSFKGIKLFGGVNARDIVIFSRQLSTLFEAKIAAMTAFRLLASETENKNLRDAIGEILNDIQGGISLSQAMSKHPNIFSKFYVSMVRSGEESGKLDEIFSYMADYLDRSYALASKARNALIYPAFVVSTMILVFIAMIIFVIPHLTSVLTESGQEIPIYTKILIGMSDFLRNFGIYLLIIIIFAAIFFWRYFRTEKGKIALSRFQISVPFIGNLYKKFYISRITDNLELSLSSGISMLKSIESAADIAGGSIYSKILLDSVNDVKGGGALSASLSRYKEIPTIVAQMIKIGEETGKLNFILKTLSNFYRKEVDNSIETMVNMIEPAMILVLGVFACLFILAIIGPIYNISANA